MLFAEFYTVTPKGELVAAVGDRSVIILDGRNANSYHHEAATVECAKRGFKGYRLCRGESFTRYAPTSGLIRIDGR